MANPNPNTEGLIKIQRSIPGGTARKPVQVKVPVNHYDAWMSLPSKKRNEFLREAIAEKLKEEGLLSA